MSVNFQSMVGYQIYPKSFKDMNGDGIGDIQGIIEKIPYLKSLGIDFVWINPIYKSPQVDGGYDISDFYAIDEMFGTLDDFKELLVKMHAEGLKVIMDLVVNHTSDQHPWFLESKKSRNNPYRDYYLWADATADRMPNDWKSFFGGSTWTYDKATEQAYFHIFASQQPDLNWKNPKLRKEIYQMIRWWLDLGVDGFRLDAISHIQKEDWDFKIKSMRGNDPWRPFMNVTGIEKYMADLKMIFDEYGALTVGEASGVPSSEASNWTDENGYIDMIFELEHNARKPNGNGQGSIYGYKETVIRWQRDLLMHGWNALYLENHDQPRAIDVFGDGTVESAKALAVSYMLLRGTPFIYQGQEVGMTNFPFTNISQTTVPEVVKVYEKLLVEEMTEVEALRESTKNVRDHSRTPMQWDSSENAGFTKGQSWMPINPNYKSINVENNKELLDFYRQLIHLRHTEKAISEGSIEFLFEKHRTLMAYKREEFLIIANLGKTKAHVLFDDIAYEQLLGSCEHSLTNKMTFSPWEYQIYRKQS